MTKAFQWVRRLCHDGLNCGFHHVSGLASWVLRELLIDYDIQFIYQPLHCPHLNACEHCFHQLKEFLPKCHILVMEEMKIAISEGVSSILTTNSHNCFCNNCGNVQRNNINVECVQSCWVLQQISSSFFIKYNMFLIPCCVTCPLQGGAPVNQIRVSWLANL